MNVQEPAGQKNISQGNGGRMGPKIKFILVLGTALLMCSSLLAQNSRGSVQVNGGMFCFLKENIDSGFKTGFGFSFPLLKKTELSFEFGYGKSSVHEEPHKLHNGTLSWAPFQASMYYYFLENKKLTPYAFGGVDLVFAHFKMEDIITIPEVSINQEVNNGISFHAGAGSLFRINHHFALYGEVCFFYRKGEGKTITTDINKGVSTENFFLNFNSFILSIGIKYYL